MEREELGEGNAQWISVVCCGPGDGEAKVMMRMMVKPLIDKRTDPEIEDVQFLDIRDCGYTCLRSSGISEKR